MNKRKHSVKGFTLVEVIIVIAIIGILAGLLVPSLMGYVRKAREKAIMTETKIIVNSASAALTDIIADSKYPLLTDKKFDGKRCGCITNWMIGRAQKKNTSEITDAKGNKVDYDIATQILKSLDSENISGIFEFNGNEKNPLSQNKGNPESTLTKFNKEHPGCSAFILIYGEDGSIVKLYYSKGNMLCIYDGSFTIVTADEKEAVFPYVQYL
ncbi:MAG: prepilin-type N-terminal cleavage/methylation domain-containing protein [Ruminococcus sp.]